MWRSVRPFPSQKSVYKFLRLFFSSIFLLNFFLHASSIDASLNSTVVDAREAKALNSIFESWNIKASALWNISGDLCSGSALDIAQFEDLQNNPSIKCSCPADGDGACHITHLRVQNLNVKGSFLKELTALTHLQVLKLDKNHLSGVLPDFIGNLSALVVLTASHNAFHGNIPKELGNLKELALVALSSNNFSGTLPSQMGNLVKLELLYLDSCGAGGAIPETFSKLKSLQALWIFDSPFTGKIPNYIGRYENLTSLRIHGNNFDGPIPSSFSDLIQLDTLWLSDLRSSCSPLDFIKNMTKLKGLILRNSSICGTIPSFMGQLSALEKLDLSFNNLTGQIPFSLFTSSSLTYLFLGNNSLTGILPPYKSDQLRSIDLSYNELSGNFPPWVTQNLQLNVVANNFFFSGSNESFFPGLGCLQRNFSCEKIIPLYDGFSIKCGGPEFMTADGYDYESENSVFSPASYYVAGNSKWAVSNVGLFADMSYASYVQKAQTQVIGTTNPQLFNTSRISPGSIRYYGLGLKNGNYNIHLLFAETAFDKQNTETWGSLGRRVFDIYIQGRLVQKDFDISKEAGGPDIALQKNYNVTVSENYVEIHLLWAGKGTCCIPGDGYYGSTISALSVVPSDFKSKHGAGNSSSKYLPWVLGITISSTVMSISLILAVFYRKCLKKFNQDTDITEMGIVPLTFTYAELKTATKDFSPTNKLGEGGFGPVYKGTLPNGRIVAVKQLSHISHHGKTQFRAELAAISVVQHRNLVKLYGSCIEADNRLIVYEYLENLSVAQALFGDVRVNLDWATRFKICLGTARGLTYLHEESRPKIVHRDVKASNILLDADLSPKISDFGLAKLYDDKKTHISTRVAGTVGYLAPEYAMRGHLTEKADVFGFGVVLLEIVAGRSNFEKDVDSERRYLLEWVWGLYESGRSLELMDPGLTIFDEEEAERVIRVALLCIQASPLLRPPMSRVVAMLTGDIEAGIVSSKPGYLTDWDFRDTTTASSSTGDTTSTSEFL